MYPLIGSRVNNLYRGPIVVCESIEERLLCNIISRLIYLAHFGLVLLCAGMIEVGVGRPGSW